MCTAGQRVSLSTTAFFFHIEGTVQMDLNSPMKPKTVKYLYIETIVRAKSSDSRGSYLGPFDSKFFREFVMSV